MKTRTLPTQHDINRLADSIARDGFADHQHELDGIVSIAASTGLYPATVEVLQSSDSPDAPRGRAFIVLCRNWATIRQAATRSDFHLAFRALADQWTRHQLLRRNPPAQLDELWASRQQLDILRTDVALSRGPG